MNQKYSLFIVLLAFLSACATSSTQTTNANATKTEQSVYWVNGKKTDCVNLGQNGCLEMQKGENKNPQNWAAFAEPIEGFTYEKGYVYKLLINEEQNLKNTPTDVFDKKYKLIRVIEKTYEPKLLLNDKWVLAKINTKTVTSTNLPTIEFNLDLRRMSANDGCNNFVGEIKSVIDNQIFFGNVIGTKKLCEDMRLANEYNPLLSKINSYEIDNQKLVIFDREKNEILRFIPAN
jgi:heat shock protein HslJ